jgi:hypothetical protein
MEALRLLSVTNCGKRQQLFCWPGMNIHRNPCAAGIMSIIEDRSCPGKWTAAAVRGIQSKGYRVPKHFCCNNQEII